MKKISLYLILFLFFCNVGKTESALPECQGDDQKQWTNCQGIQIFRDERKYVGEYKDGKRHGHGTYTYPDGAQYVGEYKDNSENGQGTYTYPDGEKYVGGWKNGKFHGQGILTYINGVVEKGVWKDGNLVESQ